jgi:hypothetical protein
MVDGDLGDHAHNDEPGITRRAALVAVPALLAAGSVANSVRAAEPRPKIAAVVTQYAFRLHGQAIVDRFLDGYAWDGVHYKPGVDVVSMYVDQKVKTGKNIDSSADRVKAHPGLKLYPTIAETLTLGGDRLAVDGVMIIGEHGTYGTNAKGQHLYPRYEFFQKVVEVFRKSGRSVPVFNDKHLSWNWEWAKQMVETARELGFGFMAGSSLPVTWRIPALELPLGSKVKEAVCVGFGGVDSYDFHGLETLQCLLERRAGGETGVKAVTAIKGDAVWRALDAGSWEAGGFDPELMEACLCRSFMLTSPSKEYGNAYPERKDLPRLVSEPVLYRIEYVDGTRSTLVMLNGLVKDFTVAVRIEGEAKPLSMQMYLPLFADGQTLPNFFNPLAYHMETLFKTGKSPYPVERTLLTSGIVIAAVDSLYEKGKRLDTPELARVNYQPTAESLFWRS